MGVNRHWDRATGELKYGVELYNLAYLEHHRPAVLLFLRIANLTAEMLMRYNCVILFSDQHDLNCMFRILLFGLTWFVRSRPRNILGLSFFTKEYC